MTTHNESFVKRHAKKLILIGVFILAILIYLFNPTVNSTMNEIFRRFATGDFHEVAAFIDRYGPWAMAISALLMVLQAVMAPLPAFLITFANANLFGWWQGAILSWSSAMLGAAVCFYISRILGRDVAEKLATRTGLESVEDFFERYGNMSILIARLLPFMSFDLVSYAAGLTPMDFWGFFIATGIGQLPATIIYSYVGGQLTGGAQKLVTALLVLFALTIFIFLLRKIWSNKERIEDEKLEKEKSN